MAKLKAKPGIKGVSVGGKEYTVDKKGFVTVPDEFVGAVLDAGFVVPQGDEDAPASTAAAAEGAGSGSAFGSEGGAGAGAGSGEGSGSEGEGSGSAAE